MYKRSRGSHLRPPPRPDALSPPRPPRRATKARKPSPPTSPAPPTQDAQIPPPTLAPRGSRGRDDPRTKTKMSTRCPASAHSESERALPEVSATLRDLFTEARLGCRLLSATRLFPALDYIFHKALRLPLLVFWGFFG